ncbi:protocadherin-15-like [Antedon mediterranea]|uniref:protocadherin-15-like n=1 Tax=Antedon mediterranea TaxID=105859 RepID=UPI003AF93630
MLEDKKENDLTRECSISGTTSFSIQEDHALNEPIGTLNYFGSVREPNATIVLSVTQIAGTNLIFNGTDLFLESLLTDSTTIVAKVSCTLAQNYPSAVERYITVSVSDVNGNAPVFVNEPYIASVSELTPIASIVFEGEAVDEDSGTNGQLQYSVVPNPDDPDADTYFGVTTVSVCNISLNKALDYEAKKVWKVKLQATDRAVQSRSTTTIVTINVLDGDDVPPYFLCYKDDDRCVTVWYYTSIFEETVSFCCCCLKLEMD